MNKKRIGTSIICFVLLIVSIFALSACGGKVNNFKLSFKVDSEVYQTITTTGNESISIPENPTKTGYEFDGWFWDKDVWSKPFTANSLLDASISSDMSVYAKFNAIEYDITYNVDGGTHNNPLSYTIEDSITLSDAEKTGYSFRGWYSDSNWTTKVETISAGRTGDIDLYAKFEIENYTITYTNTKDADNDNPTSYNVNSDTIILTNLSKDGYTFDGWYNGEDKITVIAKGSTGSLTLESRWTAVDYEIIYHNVNDATNSNPENYNVDEQPLILIDLEKAGYNFLGWFLDENFINETTEIPVGTTGEINLYAKWEIIEYTATFMDGTTVVKEVKFTVETESIDEPAVPSHVGYNGEWEEYTLGTEDITINAVYTLIPYSIIYNNVDDAINNNPTTYNVQTQTIILVDAEKEGYTFRGWYSYEDFENAVTEITTGTIGNIELYAKWQQNEYTITFDSNGGTEVESITGYYGVEIDEPSKPSKEKYYFVGWFLASGGNAYEFTTMPAENITLYARWEAYSLTLTHDETIQGVSSLKEITPESFGAKCVDNGGNLIDVLVTINGTVATGEIITVRLTSMSNGVIAQKTITNVKVYGMPTLTFDNTVDYVNIIGDFTASHFGASGVDSFGQATNIEVYIDGEYEAGQLVTVTIASIDPAGNTVYGYVENVKAYGLPKITYDKTAISAHYQLSAYSLNAVAENSFGENVNVTASCYSGTIAAGNTVIIRLSATDSKGNTNYIDVECKVYGSPRISNSSVTEIKLSDEITVDLLGITATDTFGENLDITLTYGDKVAGEILTVTADVIDDTGLNGARWEYKLKVYDNPLLIYDREGLKVNEDAEKDASVLNVVAKDSFGNALDVEIELKSGSLIVGNYVVYILTATDNVGNVTKLETAEIGVYDVNDIKLTDNAATTDKIKLSSKREEFDAKATDSFGNACDITIQPAESYSLAGGNIISLYIVATDKTGNKIYSDLIENIKVYDMPTVTFNQDNYAITEDTDLNFLFTTFDSFGKELYVEIIVGGEQKVGNKLFVTLNVNDDVNNFTTQNYSFVVVSSQISFVQLYIDGELWRELFVDFNDYILPMPNLEEGFEAFWVDEKNIAYTDILGNGVLALSKSVKLHFITYKSGYIPIYTIEQLKNLNMEGKYWLVSDLYLNDAEWEPLGTKALPFKGEFNGNGHTVSNFVITGRREVAGLFGYASGKLINLGIEEFIIEIYGGYASCVGGLVGYSDFSIIKNCYAVGEITMSVSQCNASAGGLIGSSNHDAIVNCYTKVAVTGNVGSGQCSVGGLVGWCGESLIVNSYATKDVSSTSTATGAHGTSNGSYAGGLVGYVFNFSQIYNCYAIGNITATSTSNYTTNISSSSFAGGLIGRCYGEINNSYATGNVLVVNNDNGAGSNAYYGYLVGYIDNIYEMNNSYICYGQECKAIVNGVTKFNVSNYSGEATTLSNLQSKKWIENNLWTAEIDIWMFEEGFPTLNYNVIRSNEVVVITTANEIMKLKGQCLVKNYVLAEDINLNGIDWEPILCSTGKFCGNGHILSNFNIITSEMQFLGLFRYNVGVIENLGVKDFEINTFFNSTYAYDLYLGGLVCYNFGEITNCYAMGNVISSSSRNSAYAGALVGYNNSGTIENCYAIGLVSSYTYGSELGGLVGSSAGGKIMNSYTLCDIESSSKTNNTYIGGLAGYCGGTIIINCYATGNISDAIYAGGLIGQINDGVLINCYATGNISDAIYAGGLVGYLMNENTIVNNCYATGNVSNATYAGGLVGYIRYSEVTVSNCYRYSGQIFENILNGTTSTSATCSVGVGQTLYTLQSVEFQSITLGWPSDNWAFIEGEHPTLKNVGTIS